MVTRIMFRLGKGIGLRFAPDNHVLPVLRFDQFQKLAGPGYFWINPWTQETLPPVSLGIRIGQYTFTDVVSADNIPHDINLTILYKLEPALVRLEALAQLVRLSDREVQKIVKDYASQGLRRLAALYMAESLTGRRETTAVERDLTNLLRSQLRPLGLQPLRQGGLLIKEIIPAPGFRQALLQAKQHQTTLRVLSAYKESRLIEQAIRAQLVAGLQTQTGTVNLFSILGDNATSSLLPGDWFRNSPGIPGPDRPGLKKRG
ncbi:MAG: SPFH domain-containing protein [bacterium]|nr:SPFH domain-containing protein [bacterium]